MEKLVVSTFAYGRSRRQLGGLSSLARRSHDARIANSAANWKERVAVSLPPNGRLVPQLGMDGLPATLGLHHTAIHGTTEM